MNRRCSQTQAAAWIVLLTVFNLLLALLPLAANAGIVTWDNGGDDGAWSTGNNWSGTPDNTEPAIVADAAFPTPVAGSGTIALSAGELANSLTFNDTYTLASGGTLYLGSHGATSAGYITVAASKTATIASPLYGNGWDQGASGLTKAGDGTLELTANDPTFTGGITINGGRLTTEPTDATSINRLGNNRITINGGELVLRMNDATPAGAHAVYTREVAGSGGKVTRNLSAALETTWSISAIEDATYSGSLDHGYADDKWIVSKVGPGLQEFTGTLLTNSRWRLHKVFGGELRIGGDVDHSSGTAFGNSGVYASGTLTVDNTAKNISERLPDNNYEFGGGTLKLLGSSAAASREGVGMMSLTAGYASTVDIQTGSGQTATLTFTSLTRGSGSAVNVKYTNNGTGTAGLIFGTTAPTLVNGIVSGTSNRSHLLKTGPGRLDLSTATSTYEGETIVHGGTLNVNGALAAVTGTGSHGTVTVMSGATLGGTGTINRPVTVNSGGKLAPGEGAGTLSVTGNVTMNAGGVFEVELGSSTCDLLDVTGTVRCGGTLTGVQIGSETIKRTYTVITAGSQVTGTFDNGEVTVGGVKLKIVYESNAVKLKAGDPGSLFVVR